MKSVRIAVTTFSIVAGLVVGTGLGEMSSNICEAMIKAIPNQASCPAYISDPRWDMIALGFILLILLMAIWPLIGWGLAQLIKAYIATGSWVGNLSRLIRTGIRTVTVTAIEEATGKQVFVSANDARHIVRHSEFGRNAYKQGMPGGSALARLARVGDVMGRTPDDEAAALDQFHAWLDLALSSFRKEVKFLKYGEDLSKFYRQDDSGSYEYAETELREWLKGKWVEKVTERFGGV